MQFLVLSRSPESFRVIINDICIEATVTNRSEVAATWIDEADLPDRSPLIVGIATNEKYSSMPHLSSPAPYHSPPSTSHQSRCHRPSHSFSGNIADSATRAVELAPPAISSKSSIQAKFETQFTDSSDEDAAAVVETPSIALDLESQEFNVNLSFPSSPKATPADLPLSFMPAADAKSEFSFRLSNELSDAVSVATLQLCCGNRCLVFSVLFNDRGIPDAIVNFLFDRNRVMLVGSGVRRAGDWLGRPESMLLYRDPWELGEARAWRGLRRLTSVDQLAGRLLGRMKPIRVQMVNCWDWWPLTENQVVVACLEPYLLSKIGEKLVGISREAFHCYCMCTM